MMPIVIRQEEEKDQSTVKALLRDAFAGVPFSANDEDLLVQRLRASKAFLSPLSLVACDSSGLVLGYILFTKGQAGPVDLLALSPMAVHPKAQRMGVGKALIHAGHARAKNLGYDLIVVLGHETYYPRFGYTSAALFGLRPPKPLLDKHFMAISLSGSLYALDAEVRYAPEFFPSP